MNLYTPTLAFLFLTFGLFPTTSHAQSQQEMNRHAEADFEVADAKLNVVYRKIFSGLDDEGKRKLKIRRKRGWPTGR